MFGDLLGAAGKLLGGTSPGDLQAAASDHVGGLDPSELVNHLIGMVPNLPDDARSQLAHTVLGALGKNGTAEGDVQAAGVPTDDAKNGDPAALGALLEHAKSDPGSLKDAAISYVTSNPQLIQKFAPGLMQGILGKLGA
ncbi:MAG TPA: hypothetical protein VIJ64_00540 [Candidatus Lustribacter sp.]